jgi:hypothetical protein
MAMVQHCFGARQTHTLPMPHCCDPAGGSCGLGEGDMSLLHAFTQYHSYVGISRVFDVAAALVGAGLLTGEGSRQYAARCAQVRTPWCCGR